MSPKLLFLGTPEDQPYLPRLKPLVGEAEVFVSLAPITMWTELEIYCNKRNVTGVLSTSRKLLQILSGDDSASLDSYAGSYFKRAGIEVVFLDPLPQLVSLPYGAFVTARYCSKLTRPQVWNQWPAFTHTVLNPSNVEGAYDILSKAALIAVDIETTKVNLAITSISYTGVSYTDGTPKLNTYVLSLDSDFALAWMRRLNRLPAPKVFQNGKYDCSYLLRYAAAPHNWKFDTANMFHCWYSELPKDLAMLSAFFHREGRYWKDMNESFDQAVKLEYNARDTYATAIACCEWLLQAPAWAKTNYLQEFPLNFPCVLSEMTGIKRDKEAMTQARAQIDSLIAEKSASLDKCLGVTNFNVNSPVQMKQLLRVLGCKDLESADEKNLQKAAFRHPLIARIIDLIVGPPTASTAEEFGIRGLRKLKSTYLRTDEDIKKKGDRGDKDYKGRVLYALNPHGTDTGRLASKEHHFWCGLQAQNIPRGVEVKQTLVADTDFRIAECDLEQAESRDTAHIAGCESLIAAVSGIRDFHSVNASAFFGVPYESIYSDSAKKTLNKILRDLAKRVNHGANYNMGPDVLVETMGLVNIYKAGAALGLPKIWTPRQIAEYLLACFHKAYPELSKVYYPAIVAEIKTTKMLTSRATHESDFQVAGWVRYCFKNPEKDKRALNSYIAHSPQSLNAMTLNKAYMKVFYEIAMHPDHSRNFRLLAQIHDSILFQFREGHSYLAEKVKQYMQIPVTVKGYDGKTRTFTVPAAIKAGKDGSGAYRWSETE